MNQTTAVLVVIVLLALAITNPSEEDHRSRVKQYIISVAAEDGGFVGKVCLALGFMHLAADIVLDIMPPKYNNFVIFSTLTYRGSVLSVGFLGNVIVM